MKQKYGEAGAGVIVNNTATLLIYGGTRDPDDLAAYVTLVGERDEDVRTWDHEQRVATTTTRRVPVLSAAQIAQLPFGKVVIIRRGMPAAVGRVQMAWKRPDLRRHRRQVRAIARYERWAARCENLAQWAVPRLTQAGGWLDARITAGNAWLDRQAAQPDVWSAVTGWWRARRATKQARVALTAGTRRPVHDTNRGTDDAAGNPARTRDGGRS